MIPTHCGVTLAEVEREHILDTLVCCHGNRTYAAKLLHISLRSLRIKLREYAQSGCDVCGAHCVVRKPNAGSVDSPASCERAMMPSAPCRQH